MERKNISCSPLMKTIRVTKLLIVPILSFLIMIQKYFGDFTRKFANIPILCLLNLHKTIHN